MNRGTYRTVCGFCQAGCGLRIYHNGVSIESVEGDPEHPSNRGYCCQKVLGIRELSESRDRLSHPLRRTSGGFEKISWDEAIRWMALRLGEVRERYGPNALVRNAGAPVSYEARDGFVQFMGAFGSPNLTGAGNLCMLPRITAFSSMMGERPEPDLLKAKLILFWGANPVATNRFGGFCAFDGFHRIIPRAKERGARIIVIDPVRSATVEQADEWLQIKPGTDTALGLAMIHWIIAEGLYDRKFVAEWTTGFDRLAEHVRPYTPEWGGAITGLSPNSIIDLARQYAKIKPAAIGEGGGMDMYANGVDTVRTVAALIALSGNLDVPGGNAFPPFALQSTLPTKNVPMQNRNWFEIFPIFREVPFPAIKEAILRNEEHRPRAMIVHHSNPLLIQANQARTREALEKLDFLVVNDIFLTATAELADLVLPSTSHFERFGYRAYSSFEGGFLAFARPVADPPGEARTVFEVEYAIAEEMGFHQNYPFQDTKSWLEFMLKPTGVSLERLDAEQIVYATSTAPYRNYLQKGFRTSSGKLEFCSQVFPRSGASPLPVYAEPAGEAITPVSRRKRAYPLMGTSRRPSPFVHTNFRNIQAIVQSYPEPLLWIHPQDASVRGIQDRDRVIVTSSRGRISLTAKMSEDTQEGLVLIDFGWGNPSDGKGSLNLLTNDEYWDPVSGATPNRIFSCEVVKEES